ncbi:hypothetical protein PILCRDRAFT_505726 [Piloderma croceum F 1598]|uniref:Uncharacterized protein n=1 Tax=Piloderma croceum (strain F 1598) TaxID=765440 RepID=A0A0C3FPY6_PILCF|nr:hypothetical protein PILCRDRAFT_505726 [Piloderma croceum F 1598]
MGMCFITQRQGSPFSAKCYPTRHKLNSHSKLDPTGAGSLLYGCRWGSGLSFCTRGI